MAPDGGGDGDVDTDSDGDVDSTTDGPCDLDGDGADAAACGGDDCDDSHAGTLPGASETFGDGIDQDCDGVDAVDMDGDGHASTESGGDDCNDVDDAVHPGAADGWEIDDLGSGDGVSLALAADDSPRIAYRGSLPLFRPTFRVAVAGGWELEEIEDVALDYAATVTRIDAGVSHVAYVSDLAVRYAKDAGDGWTAERLPYDGATQFLSLAVRDGVVHLAYAVVGAFLAPEYAIRDELGWGFYRVDEPSSGQTLSVVLDDDGLPHIVYYADVDSELRHAVAEGLRGSFTLETIPTVDAEGVYPSAVFDSDGRLEVAYGTSVLAVSTDAIAGWTEETVDDDREALDVSLAIDSADALHAAYNQGDVGLWYATNVQGGWATFEVDDGSAVGPTAVAVGSDGRPHVAWSTATPEVRHATTDGIDQNCDGWAF